MRRDVKLGLAIGGVFILVVVVFAIINSTHHNQPGADLTGGIAKLPETPVAPGPAVAPTNSTGVSDNMLTSTSTTEPSVIAGSPTTAPETSTAGATDKKTDWALALTHGTFDADSRLVHTSPMNPDEKLDNGGGQTAPTAPAAPAAPATPDSPLTTETPTAPATGASAVTPASPNVATAAPADPSTRTDADQIISAAYNVSATQPAGMRTHVIRAGETFSSISLAAYGNARYYLAIAKANPTVNPNKLRPNTTIVLPEISQAKTAEPAVTPMSAMPTTAPSATPAAAVDSGVAYVVKPGDSLYKISEKLYGDAKHTDELYQNNKDLIGPNPEKLKLGMVLKLTTPPVGLH